MIVGAGRRLLELAEGQVRGIGLALPLDGDQFELELAGPGRAWQEPWEGKSPRGLTKCAEKFSLGAPPTGGLHGVIKVCPKDSQRELAVQLSLPFGP